jgi:hypothetical protein
VDQAADAGEAPQVGGVSGNEGMASTQKCPNYPPQPGPNIKISNIGKPKPSEERGTMFEWLCIICLFSCKFASPNQSTDQTLF